MKNLFCFILFLTCTALNAQVPQAINYQAVYRNANGFLVKNQSIIVECSVREGSASGTILYSETHNVNTNDAGLFTISIGEGSNIVGVFSNIAWENGAKWCEIKIGSVLIGAFQFKSVPYALQAKNAKYAEDASLQYTEAVHTSGSHSSNNRSDWFELSQAPLNVTVPSTGKYLILAKIRVQGFTNNDRIYITASINGSNLRSYVIAGLDTATNSDRGDASGTAYWIYPLVQGQSVSLKARIAPLGGITTSTVTFEDGEFSIVKLSN